MYTYQDFISDSTNSGLTKAVESVLNGYWASTLYKTAVDADEYDAQRNTTIMQFMKVLYTAKGQPYIDLTSANNKITSNFFARLNTQRKTYSLGNGVFFKEESTKLRFEDDFDRKVQKAGYAALIHGVSYIFLNLNRLDIFKATEFAPLWNEETGELMAGVRWWRIDAKKPLMVELYEPDGVTKLKKDKDGELVITAEKQPYKLNVQTMAAEEGIDIISGENWDGALPIIPCYGSRLKQSTLVGMKAQIDSYDLIRSGFADDLTDCSEIYWIINGAGASTEADLERFRNRLKTTHMASMVDEEVTATPYTQEIPYAARQTYLDSIRAGIYEAYGGLDVHTIAAGATNDHIDAAYQPVDEQADDYEECISDAICALLKLMGIDDAPTFKRNRISNEREQVDMVISCADYLDEETVLRKLPFIDEEDIEGILDRKTEEMAARYSVTEPVEDGQGEGNADE